MKKIIISGGGTGGHVFPAIAIGRAIMVAAPDTEILFIGAKGRLEMDKVPAAGFRIEGLNITGFQRRLTLKNLAFPVKLLGSLRSARKILRQFKPDSVVGVGGYASGPTLRMAVSLHIPVLIQEQNSFPGITNRLLGRHADVICVAYDGMDRYFPPEKLVFTGNPVRNDLIGLKLHDQDGYSYFGLKPGKFTVLVTGGSGGAETINKSIIAAIGDKAGKDVQYLWQTGRYYYDRVIVSPDIIRHEPVAACKGISIPGAVILPFIDRMDLAYSVADLVISRAGAIAISEFCVAGKAVILIPSPNVAEDHQTKNASSLADRDAAILLPDEEAVAKLPGLIGDLVKDPYRLAGLQNNINRLAITDAAEKIAGRVLALAEQKTLK
jgi:UDP-N-acetylglucosamine--N-acetylmuramyl-(pentapeptide) pyrophosphoryl-undecaprenol N-acetylglucosamine transferase